MRVIVTYDIAKETNVDKVVSDIEDMGLRDHFQEKDYGAGLRAFGVVLMCRDPDLVFKRRIRHARKESAFYMDIMLDYQAMVAASHRGRQREIARRLFDEVPAVLLKYKIPDFDRDLFLSDFQGWISNLDWI